jgi:hypothetical protein
MLQTSKSLEKRVVLYINVLVLNVHLMVDLITNHLRRNTVSLNSIQPELLKNISAFLSRKIGERSAYKS